jgi:hypothetical protein
MYWTVNPRPAFCRSFLRTVVTNQLQLSNIAQGIKNMKRSLLLASVLALALTACGEKPAPAPKPAAAPAPAPAPAPAEAPKAEAATDAPKADAAAAPVAEPQKDEKK